MTHLNTSLHRLVCFALVVGFTLVASRASAQQESSLQELAITAFHQGDYGTAYDRLNTLMEGHEPSSVPAHAYLLKALIERQNETFSQSITTFEQGLIHYPSHRELMMELAVTYSWSERIEEALLIYERLLRDTPSDLAALQGRARMLSWLGRYEEALSLYAQMRTDPETRQHALLGAAFVYKAQGRRQKARGLYEMVLEEDPSHAEALEGLQAIEDIEVGRASYQVHLARNKAGDSNMEMRAGLMLRPRSSLVCTFEYVMRTDSLALTTAIPQQSGHLVELGFGSAVGRRHHLGVQVGYQLDTHTWRLGAEGQSKLAAPWTLSYGIRHQSATASFPDVQVYRLGLARPLTPHQEILIQGFVSTLAIQRLESFALATRHHINLRDGRLVLAHTLAPEFSGTNRAGFFGESSLRLNARRWSIELGAQAGFRRTPFAGLRSTLTRSF